MASEIGYCPVCDKDTEQESHITSKRPWEVKGYTECRECGTRFYWEDVA